MPAPEPQLKSQRQPQPATASRASPARPATPRSALYTANRRFYDNLWRHARLVEPDRFNTWPLIQSLAGPQARRLEVAPGLRPRLPIAGTRFVDISPPALRQLAERGGQVALGSATALPLAAHSFDLLCAFDIIEHVEDDLAALEELARVAAPEATLIVSVPLHPSLWTPFDTMVGHYRRYRPEDILHKLAQCGFEVTHSALYGMKPRSSRLVNIGMWFLEHQRERAMWWYNRVGMPLGLRFQKPLQLQPGLLDVAEAGEILLVCRYIRSSGMLAGDTPNREISPEPLAV